MGSLFTHPPSSAFTTRPSGKQQWEAAIEQQRQRRMWDALKPSAGEQIGTGISHYLHGGVPELLQQQFGMRLPGWINATNDFFHRNDVNAALGVITPIKTALPKYYVSDFFENQYLKGKRFDSAREAHEAAKKIPANENGVFVQRDDGDYLHTISDPIDENPEGYIHDVVPSGAIKP